MSSRHSFDAAQMDAVLRDCRKVLSNQGRYGLVGRIDEQRRKITPEAALDVERLRAALDNLLRHHNAGSYHVPSTNLNCEFARQASAALAKQEKP